MNIKNLINNDITQDDYLRYNNTTLLFKKLPKEVNGLIVRKYDINIIIVNDYLSDKNKRKTFLHELGHLELNHTYKYRIISNDSSVYEQDVDNYIDGLIYD